VRRERDNAGLTQEKLAELSDLSTRSIQRIEKGEFDILTTTTYRLKKALGCKWEKLMD